MDFNRLLRENYIKASHGVMIIYAVNNRQSYDAVNGYIDYVRGYVLIQYTITIAEFQSKCVT
jgi:GTPase SAR1 family protein